MIKNFGFSFLCAIVLNFCLVEGACAQATKFSVPIEEFVQGYIPEKYKVDWQKQALLPKPDLFVAKGVSEFAYGQEPNAEWFGLMNQRQIVTWVYPLLGVYGFNENMVGEIEYLFYSLQKETPAYTSFVAILTDYYGERDFFLITIDKSGEFIDGLLLCRSTGGLAVDPRDYQELKCNPLDMPPPYLQEVVRRATLSGSEVAVFEECKILKNHYETLGESERSFRVVLKSVFEISSDGRIECVVKKGVIVNPSGLRFS